MNWLLVLLLTATVINYPNPFNPKGGESTSFECTTDTSTAATLYIYDMAARLILKKAFDLQAGLINQAGWDGLTDFNEMAGNGIYPYQIISKSGTRVGRGKIWVINK